MRFAVDDVTPARPGKSHFDVPGIIASDVPSGLSSVSCTLVHPASGVKERVSLEGGLLGVAVDEDGALEPRAGWLVRREAVAMRDVVTRLLDATGVVRAREAAKEDYSGELAELFDAIESANIPLRDGDLRILPPSEHRTVLFHSPEDGQIRLWRGAERVVDLPGGEFLARVEAGWARMRADKVREVESEGIDEVTGLPLGRSSKYLVTEESEDALPVLGRSLARILADALDGRLE